MATHAVVRIPEVDDEFEIPADDLLVNESGELTVLQYGDSGEVDSARVRAVFASYTYAILMEDEEDELEHALAVARRHGFVIDDALADDEDEDEEDDDEDEEEDDEDDEEEEDDDYETVELPDFTVHTNGHDASVDAADVSLLVPVTVSEPADDESGAPRPSLS
jgi:hypothetical protein